MACAADCEPNYQRAVKLLSLGFFGVFGGFQAAQGLQSSLNAQLGEVNLASLYGTFTMLCLVTPPLLQRLEGLLRMQGVLLVCALAYAAMALSNLLHVPAQPSELWAVPIGFNALVGVAAPFLWTGQNTYLSRCASRAALAEAGQAADETTLLHWRTVMTTRYNSVFFSIYQFSGMFGNIVASSILLILGADEVAKSVLFVTLTCVSVLGAFCFLLMPTVSGSSETDEQPSVLDTARLAFTDARVGLLIPLMLTNGMTLAFFLGDFQAEVTCPAAGPQFTGFIVATFYGVNSLATAAWGRLISSGWLFRRSAFALCSVLIATYLLIKLLWQVPTNYMRVAGSNDWQQMHQPSAGAVATVFSLAALFATGDAFWEAGPAMTLQTFYSKETVVPAMANYKLWQSLGFAIQFWIAIPLKGYPEVRGGLLLVLVGFSMICVLLLSKFVCSLDEEHRLEDEGHARERPLVQAST